MEEKQAKGWQGENEICREREEEEEEEVGGWVGGLMEVALRSLYLPPLERRRRRRRRRRFEEKEGGLECIRLCSSLFLCVLYLLLLPTHPPTHPPTPLGLARWVLAPLPPE